MQQIDRTELKRMLDAGQDFELVEVLGEEAYQDFHLPDAKNVPLNGEFEKNFEAQFHDKKKPIVVYCKDSECSASDKAAERLESAGYVHVYDYGPGKVDWKSAGLKVESSS